MKKFWIFAAATFFTWSFAKNNVALQENIPTNNLIALIKKSDSLNQIQIIGERFFISSTKVSFEKNDENKKIFYRVRPAETTEFKTKFLRYKKPFTITENSIVEVYQDNQKNDVKTYRFFKRPNNWSIVSITPPHPHYANGESLTIIDGLKGSAQNPNNNWLGFESPVVEIVIDRHVTEELKTLTANFLQDKNLNILFPEKVEFFLSDSKMKFIKMGTVESAKREVDKAVEPFTLNLFPTTARFIKLKIYQSSNAKSHHNSKPPLILIDEVDSK